MKLAIFVVLALYHVSAMSQSVRVYVDGVVPEYKTLTFKSESADEKIFGLISGPTTEDNIQVENKAVNEDNIALAFSPKTAGIDAVVQPSIVITTANFTGNCDVGANCIKQITSAEADTFKIDISKVGSKQVEMKCEGGTILSAKLVPKPASAAAGSIEVDEAGTIAEASFTLGKDTTSCTITEIMIPEIVNPKTTGCTFDKKPCFDINAGMQVSFGLCIALISWMTHNMF